MGPADPEALTAVVDASALRPRYAEHVDRESAREKLAARLAAAAQPLPDPEPVPQPAPESEPPRPRRRRAGNAGDENPIVDYLTSRQGKAMVKKVTRGVLGMIRRRL
jgi:hypothetical protein